MQVVFLQGVAGTARKGEIKNVKVGFFRNYLLPRKLAAAATDSKIRETEKIRKNEVVSRERIKAEAGSVKQKIEGVKVVLKAKSKGDKLYGSITEKEIIDALEKSAKIKLGKENVKLSEHIKVAGSYEVPVMLAEGVEATIRLEVKGEK